MRHSISLPIFLILWAIQSCSRDATSEENLRPLGESQLLRVLDEEKSNLSFTNQIVENNRINILNYLYYYNGSGVAAGDINNDGLPDLYFASTVGKNKLFLNKGELQFEDITESAGAAGDYGITTGVNFVDINGDGWLDIYICKSGVHSTRYRTNQLLINDGNLGFTEQAAEFGLADPSFSNQAYFFDFDLDNDLDMYLVNHPIDWLNINKIMTGEQESKGFDYQFSDKLYRNNGKEGFEDITRQAGILNRSWGLSASIGDFDGDGRPDIYVANDFIKPDNLYINNGDGTFSDHIQRHFKHISFFSMGSDFADINNDGLNDLYVADMAMKDHARSKKNMGSMSTENFKTIVRRGYHYPYAINTLQLNVGNYHFIDIAQSAGVAKTDWSWTPLLLDLDNDGFKDLFVTNGIYRDIIDNDFLAKKEQYDKNNSERNYFDDLIDEIPQTKVSNFVFRNNGHLGFEDKSTHWGLTKKTCSNGAAYADLDMDGDLDIITNNLNEPSIIYENLRSEYSGNHYIKIKLTGPAGNLNALGAAVEIQYDKQLQRCDLMPSRGYLSASDPMLHFGLGSANEVDLVKVTWPDGKVSLIKYPSVNQVLEVKYAKATGPDSTKTATTKSLFRDITKEAGITFRHTEKPYDDFATELLLPHQLSQNGPFVAVADVNSDGLEDFFVGGAAGQAGALYIQDERSRFGPSSTETWRQDRRFEDQRALFFDVDQDGDSDLYVVSGSNEFREASHLVDRLYLNDGRGNFSRTIQSLPPAATSGMAVDAGDIDNDGDLDLVVGGRVQPSRYPKAPKSFLLLNEGGKFKDITPERAPELENLGMITDMTFSDFDRDGDIDLVIVGEWMAITILENQDGNFKITEKNTGLESTQGWWFSLRSGDVDLDGDIDYIAGNIGSNNKYQPNEDHPLHIYYDDFDNNRSGDIVLSKIEQGILYPVRGRECSSQQMPFIADKYPDFAGFAKASLSDIFTDEKLSNAIHYQATEFKSCLLMNDGSGHFQVLPLSSEAQFSPLMGIELLHLNADHRPDIVAAGNFFKTETETIRYDAGAGVCLINNDKGEFSNLPYSDSGLFLPGDVKDLASIQLANGSSGLLVTNNNEYLQLFEITSK